MTKNKFFKVCKIRYGMIVYAFCYFFLAFFCSLNAANAQTDNLQCSHVLTNSGAVQISRQWDAETNICYINLHSMSAYSLKYRDYSFNSSGQLMVFNSFGDGSASTMTGAKNYFVFPIVKDYPEFKIEDNGDVTVQMVSGHLFRVSAKDFSVVSFDPGEVQELPLAIENQAGIELKVNAGFWFDSGFKIGSDPLAYSNEKSWVQSSQNSERCQLRNNQFLNYDSDGNYSFKFKGQKLIDSLRQLCPQIILEKVPKG